ncbi:MAG: hypothetical protein ACFFEU_03435 [Candidatus Thorarchaeota archaeon]
MKELRKGYSNSRASRTVDRYMVAICVLFVFALCSTSYSAAAQNPNLLDQMEQHFNELTDKANSWSEVSESNIDILALDAYDIGLWSESASLELEPEQGYIEIEEQYLPDVIPLCITQEDLDKWGVYVHVYGGYELKGAWLKLYQKDYDWRHVCVDFLKVDGACCSDYYYKINFTLPGGVDHLCFDANNFPDDSNWWPFEVGIPDGNALDKEIKIKFCSLWSGCIEPTQEFTISIAR